MSLKWGFERRFRDAAGIVRDRGRGDRGDHFEEVIFAEAGREESIDVVIVETSAFFDHRFRQSRKRSELAVLRQTALADRLDIRRIDPLLERQRRMERDGPCARVGHSVGEQNGLDLRFRKAAAMDIPEKSDEAVTAIAATPASNVLVRIQLCKPESLSCESAFI
jgi:hypothetical protein